MKTLCFILVLLLGPGLAVWAQTDSGTNTNSTAPVRPKIYDESANGSKQIAAALATAAKEHKRVLVQFGANWCGWCHLLHKLFESDADMANELKKNYVVVMIDVDKGHNQDIDARYENPIRFGLPVIVLLDANGKPLITQNTGKFEVGHGYDRDKIIAFLKAYAPGQEP